MTAFLPLPIIPILFIGIAFLFLPPAVVSADGPRPGKDVLVVLSSDGEIHRAVLHGMADVLRTQGSKPRLDIHTWKPGTTNEADLLSKLSLHPNLIVAIGTRATQTVLEAETDVAVLSVLVPKSTYRQLTTENGNQGAASAVYLDQPPERQMALARVLLPGARSAGLLFGYRPTGRERQLRVAAERQKLRLNLESVDSLSNAAEAIKRLLRSSDLLLALYDPVALKPMTAKWLLYMAYQRGLPVIGFSRAYLKAGAVASVFSTPEQIGRQAGERLLRWLENGGTGLGDPQYPKYYSVDFNQPVAESLEIGIPDNGEVMQRMRALLGERE